MKKNHGGLGLRKSLNKLTRFPGVLLFLICCFAVNVSANDYSQNTRLSLNLKNKSLKEVFNAIEEQSEFIFFYEDKSLDIERNLTIIIENSNVEEILDNIFRNTNNVYRIVDRQIIIGVDRNKKINTQTKDPQLIELKSDDTSENEQERVITGIVIDATDHPLPGATVVVKGTTIGTITDEKGNFILSIPSNTTTLVVSFIGMVSKEVMLNDSREYKIELVETNVGLEEVVVVGYGQQKKESVVGSIVQASSETLERTGGVANLGQALTGLLPGVTTIQKTGEPGADDPTIYIRGQSTWNNAQPLILVDGIERKMNDIDISEVENVSVLKDASATAVFGVKGAEGVILITTKRGQVGKPKLEFGYNTSFKTISRLPQKLNSYDGLSYRNQAIENELSITEQGWAMYTPIEILDHYRNPQPGDEYIFPDVNWADEITRDFGVSHRANINISGGTNFVKYFGSLSYTHEGDLLNSGQALNRPYESKFAYDRFNFRTNLDLNVTKSTVFSVNLAGYYGIKSDNYSSMNYIWDAIYSTAPNAYPVTHEYDPNWGYTIWGYNPQDRPTNPMHRLNNTGLRRTNRSQILTDFKLKQKLDCITEGLAISGTLSYDNRFNTTDGIYEKQEERALFLYIDPNIINMGADENVEDYYYYDPPLNVGANDFDFLIPPVSYNSERSVGGSNYRRIFYQLQANYDRSFDLQKVGAMLLLNREEFAQGSMFPRYREDWVGRLTYDYDQKYLFEANGAYNGSEKFGNDYRFGFFPSVAVGWILSKEKFFNVNWMDYLKVRYSIGKVGNDAFNSPRWSYNTQWIKDGQNTNFGDVWAASPYTQYVQGVIGNPNLQWETAVKQNLGFETTLLDSKFRLNVDLFQDDRDNIFMTADQRNIPVFFGAKPVAANLGKTKTKGYEFELNYNQQTKAGLHYWTTIQLTHAKDEIIYMEDPELTPAYQKNAGYQIGQTKTIINNGYVNNWDEVYASVGGQSGNEEKLPGDLRLIDYNADGVIDNFDNVPYAYPSRPQNTYNLSIGFEFKGFSLMAQFYGVTNVTTKINLAPFTDALQSTVFDYTRNSWNPDNLTADYIAPRLYSKTNTSDLFLIDGSYLRFKTAEIAYTFRKKDLTFLGANNLKIFVNGNNLFLWSNLPDDREAPSKTYPMFKRFNIGLNLSF
ncbi:TonB-dependent receptor [uncultured Draconibacterium sp.]|uniref:TonB-dependent receptor n=1 Tax=uncultured Draconibacterium sp. TaxID=1573823 RepID=UPI0029C96366|nr:TonB-dependent receptor [uncultured Draconibacterium sp.]